MALPSIGERHGATEPAGRLNPLPTGRLVDERSRVVLSAVGRPTTSARKLAASAPSTVSLHFAALDSISASGASRPASCHKSTTLRARVFSIARRPPHLERPDTRVRRRLTHLRTRPHRGPRARAPPPSDSIPADGACILLGSHQSGAGSGVSRGRIRREPSWVRRRASRVAREPSRVAREPSRVAREPSRVAREPSRVAREPSRVAREPSRDYVRGRCMKTTIVVRADGTFVLDTVNRGEAATRWVARLQGKKLLQAVAEHGAEA
jgi:hypothetical protein